MRSIRFRQSKALELHHPFPITGKEICKQFEGKEIFEKASFQFPLGAKIVITGANGSGKTTLFKMILHREHGISVSLKRKSAILPKRVTSLTVIRVLWSSC